jgi:hypothetical protein
MGELGEGHYRCSAGPPALGTRDPLRKVQDGLSCEYPPGVGGEWWSAPAAAGLPYTTRRLRSFTAVELVCRDDSFGERQASIWNVNVAAGARVAEVHGLADWARLAEAYPLDVTGARRAEWSGRYGWAGPWLVPDWSRLARDWDGVHVSAEGYLRAQEQAAPVRDGRTVLAGWNPDATYWLRDVIRLTESVPERWIRESGALARWRKAALAGQDDPGLPNAPIARIVRPDLTQRHTAPSSPSTSGCSGWELGCSGNSGQVADRPSRHSSSTSQSCSPLACCAACPWSWARGRGPCGVPGADRSGLVRPLRRRAAGHVP